MPRVEERTELKCRSCGEIVPTDQYSYSQKKKKHRRRCPPCVACALYLRGDGPKPANLSASDESKMSEGYGQIQLTEQLLPPQNLSGVSHLKTIVVEPTHAPASGPGQRRARTEAHKSATASSIPATYQNSSSTSSAQKSKSKKKSAQKQKAALRKSRAAAAAAAEEAAAVSPASSQESAVSSASSQEFAASPASSQKSAQRKSRGATTADEEAVSPASSQKSAQRKSRAATTTDDDEAVSPASTTQQQTSAQRASRVAATTTAEAVSPVASSKSSASSSSNAKALSPTVSSSSSSSSSQQQQQQQQEKSAASKSRDERDVAEELLADNQDDEAVFKKPKTKKEQEVLQFQQFEEAEAGFVGGKQLDVQEAEAETFVKLKKTPKPEHRRTPSSSDQARALYLRQLSGRKKIRSISRDLTAEQEEEPELMKGGKGRKRLGPLSGGYPRESMKPGPERVIGA